MTGGTAFLDRAEVKDLIAYLRLINNADDDAAFLRVVNMPRRDIGATTLEKLGALAGARHVSMLRAAQSDAVLAQIAPRAASSLGGFAGLIRELAARAERMAAADLVDELSRRIGYADHVVAQVKEPALRERRLGESHGAFRLVPRDAEGRRAPAISRRSSRCSRHGDRDEPGNAVRLMTLHSAKGLEFRFVTIVGVEEGSLPHEGSLAEGRIEEERRLMYVGITRAKEQVDADVCEALAALRRDHRERAEPVPRGTCRPTTCTGRAATPSSTPRIARSWRPRTSRGSRACSRTDVSTRACARPLPHARRGESGRAEILLDKLAVHEELDANAARPNRAVHRCSPAARRARKTAQRQRPRPHRRRRRPVPGRTTISTRSHGRRPRSSTISIYREVYRDAGEKLRIALKDPTLGRATEERTQAPLSPKLKPAVIVDIDETVLDNSPYQARLVANGKEFDEFSWSGVVPRETREGAARRARVRASCRKRGVTVFYLSNRAQD